MNPKPLFANDAYVMLQKVPELLPTEMLPQATMYPCCLAAQYR